jgi:hypothetical protein
MEMRRRRKNPKELSNRSNRRPWLSFQDLQNSSIDIFKRGSAELGWLLRSERCTLISRSQHFTLCSSNAPCGRLPLTQQRSQAVSSPCGGGSSPHTSDRFPSIILNGYWKRRFSRSIMDPRCRFDVIQET